MSDKNNNEQDQNKQDAEKKYSIDEENKYGAHGTEEDISSNFSGQNSEHENGEQKENKNIEQGNKSYSDSFSQEDNSVSTHEYNQNQESANEINTSVSETLTNQNEQYQSQEYEQTEQGSANETNTNISEILTNQNEQYQSQEHEQVSPENANETNISASENIFDSTLKTEENAQLTSESQITNNQNTSSNSINQNNSNENMLKSSDNTVQKTTPKTIEYNKHNNTQKSGVRSSNVRTKTNITTKSSSDKSDSGTHNKFKEKVLGWGKAVANLFHRDKDKNEATNVLSNTASFMVNNPYTDKLVGSIKRSITISVMKKISLKNDAIFGQIEKLAQKKAESLMKKGLGKLPLSEFNKLMDDAAVEVAEGIMGKFSIFKTGFNAISKGGKGDITGAGSEVAQQAGWTKLLPAALAHPHIVVALTVLIVLVLISIGISESISHSTKNKELIDMNRLDEFAYSYEKKEDYSADQSQDDSNNTNDLMVDLYDEHVAVQNQNKTYKWLNDYFLNVNSPNHPKNVNNIKEISKDILLEFAKKIIVAKKKKYQINDDAFLNYLYEIALGNLFETDINVRKQILLDYIINKLGDRDKIITDTDTLSKQIDNMLSEHIGTMADIIKTSAEDAQSEDDKKQLENKQGGIKNIIKSNDNLKNQVIAELKMEISNTEFINIPGVDMYNGRIISYLWPVTRHQISDDIFLNYFYEMALGKTEKQTLLEDVARYLERNLPAFTTVRNRYVNLKRFERELDKFNKYIDIAVNLIKKYKEDYQSEDDEQSSDNPEDDEQSSDNPEDDEQSSDNPEDNEQSSDQQKKEKVIAEFKKNITDDEVIEIEYYEKILDDNDNQIQFENENILGSQKDIYELMYFLYFVDRVQADYFSDDYVLDINKYKSLIENIYNESTKLNLNLIWDSSDGIENELNFIFAEKKEKDTSASMESTDFLKSAYKKIYDDLNKRITSMDEEVDEVEYDSDSIFNVWAIFNNELEYLDKDNVDLGLLAGNSKLANSYKALLSKTLKFITEMRKYTDKFWVYSGKWKNELKNLKEYLNQIAKGDKSKSQVKDISQDIFDHLNKLKDMAYATGWNQSGSKDTKKVFKKYVGAEISKPVGYYYGNSLFRDLYIFKEKLKKFSDVTITKTMIKPNSDKKQDINDLADVWLQFKVQLIGVTNSYSDKYIFGTCYEQFPKDVDSYFNESIKEIESGEKLGSEIEKIVDEKIIPGLNNLLNALDSGLELNNQKFDEKKNIMYEHIKKDGEKKIEENKDAEDSDIDNKDRESIEIYENIDLNDLEISEDETRFKKININSHGTEDIYFLFDDIKQIKNIKSVFIMNKFGTWLSDSDFYQMFFVDDDYGFYIDEKIEGNQEENLKQDDISGTNKENLNKTESSEIENKDEQADKNAEKIIEEAINKLASQYETGSYYAEFKDSILQFSRIYDSMLTHDAEKIIDFGYALIEKNKGVDKNDDYIDSEYYDFMEIKNLIPGENIYSICDGLVDTINRDGNKLVIKYYDLGDKKFGDKKDDKKTDEDDEDSDDEDYDDDDDSDDDDDDDPNDYIDDFENATKGFSPNQDLYIVYEGLNINSNLSIGQEIIRNLSGTELAEKDFESKKSTVIGTAIKDNLKMYAFLVTNDEVEKKEFVNPFLICDIHSPFKPEILKPSKKEEESPSPSPTDERNEDQYHKDENKSEIKSTSTRVPHRTLLKVFGEIIHVAGMIYAVWAIIKFSLGMHDYESVNYQAIWQFFAASILIFGGILLKYISGLE